MSTAEILEWTKAVESGMRLPPGEEPGTVILRASIFGAWEEEEEGSEERTYSSGEAVRKVFELLQSNYGSTFDRYAAVMILEAQVIQPSVDDIATSPLARALDWAEEVIGQVEKRKDWVEVVDFVRNAGFDVVDRKTGRKLGED